MSSGELDLELHVAGCHWGALRVPHSRDDSAWGTLEIPVASVIGQPGPTVLLTGASHGDELEGPIVLAELARQLDPTQIRGRVLIVPALNLPALEAGTRLSPIDGKNMNRVFPGDSRGTITEQIADIVFRTLVEPASLVLDLHAGGQSLDFLPTAVVHHLEDREQMQRTLAALRAFGAPVGLVLHELDARGMLDTVVEERGKTFVSTELGGAARVSPTSLAITRRGVAGILHHAGLMTSAPPEPTTAMRLMTVRDGSSFVTAERRGLFEPCVCLADSVEAGDVVARVHTIDDPESEPVEHRARRSGTVIGLRARAMTVRGDALVIIAQDYDPPSP